MKESYAAGCYEKACALLPGRLSLIAMSVSRQQMAKVEEIRLRIGQPVCLAMPEGELALPQTRVIATDLEYVLDRVTEFSRYTAAESLRQGYVTSEGGFRVGVCGTMLISGDQSQGISEISSLSIRIPRAREDLAHPLLNRLLDRGKPISTLILSPPGGGKTTFLRDLVRLVSDGCELCEPMRVSLVDERGEIAAMYRGEPQLAVGGHTDVMDGCPKALAVPMLMRSMNPQVIAVDEIALSSDVAAVLSAVNCGVVLLATVHGSSVDELMEKPVLEQLFSCNVFEKAVVISGRGEKREYRVESLP